MDQPTPDASRSGMEPRSGADRAQSATDVMRLPGRAPAGVLSRPPASEPNAAPVHGARGGGAPALPEVDFDIESLVTEDDTPVDNMPSEKQQRLLTEPLYSSWAGPGAGRTFLAAANVGVFSEPRNPAIVPDVFVSLDVQVAENWWEKAHRAYLVWEFGKAPDLVLEIVSNREGNEDGRKKLRYERMGVGAYVIYDPWQRVMAEELRIYRLSGGRYERQEERWFAELRLGMRLWEGEFEGVRSRWLRWQDERGELIPTGREQRERAEQERERAEQERERAEQERERAEQERERAERAERRAERLAALLRRSGIDPDSSNT